MKKFLFHLFLIILLLCIPVIESPDFNGTLSVFRAEPFQREFLRFFFVIIFFYINLFILLPKYFNKNKKYIFAFLVAFCFCVTAFLPFILIPNQQPADFQNPPNEMRNMPPPPNNFGNHPMDRNPNMNPNPPMRHDSNSRKAVMALLPFMFSFLSSFFIFRTSQQKELEKSKAKTELLSLKYQLQPHFLFNILNSVYSLTLLKSDDAPNSILKLSNVMRYVVQESEKDFVELQKEIDYLKDYIALHLLRTDDSLDFSYTEKGKITNQQIAPFILVNFIENAFKYGYNAEENSKISIDLEIYENNLNFKVANNIVNQSIGEDQSLKVGIKNTLLHLSQMYPQKHEITFKEDKHYFEVQLQLDLT